MKKLKFIGITTLAAVIVLSFVALSLTGCPPEPDPVHEHQWGAWTQTKAPTCTTAGEETRTCTLDATHIEIQAVPIDPNAHNWQLSPTATAPTCTVDGNGDQVCSYNPEHIQSGVIPKLGHDYQNYSQTTAPTCTTAGVETGICTRDATHTTTRSVAALGHNYQNYVQTTAPTCTTAGIETGTCTRDQVTTTRAVVALGHDYQNYTQTTAPTCTASGIETGTCIRDPTHKDTRTGATALGHDYQNYTQTTAPTCTEIGITTGTCAHDSTHKDTRPIDALGHDWNTETGLCNNCDDLYYNIGDTGPGGGKIFYRSETGFTMTDDNSIAHYLEAAPIDMTTTLAWTSTSFIPSLFGGTGDWVDISGTATDIGTGRKNTALILATDATAPAAKTDYSNNGLTDWFLPSKDELNQLYENRTSVGDLRTTVDPINHTSWYWSSSQTVYLGAWSQGFSDGSQSSDAKHNTYSVRAVRAF